MLQDPPLEQNHPKQPIKTESDLLLINPTSLSIPYQTKHINVTRPKYFLVISVTVLINVYLLNYT